MPQAVIGCDLARAFIDTCELPAGKIGRIAIPQMPLPHGLMRSITTSASCSRRPAVVTAS